MRNHQDYIEYENRRNYAISRGLLGGDEALLAINVRYSGYDSVEEVQEAKEHLRAEIKKRFPIFADIYIDASLEEN